MPVEGISDPVEMSEWREGLDLGRVKAIPGAAKGVDAKFRIAELLDIEINCVKELRERTVLEA
jgi:dimethylamine--corrinoid protein Co-methyltransferase